MASHPLFSHIETVGMLTGENPRFQSAPGGHEALGRELLRSGYRFEPTKGKYQGQSENSYIVYGMPKEKLMALGAKYGQESVLHSHDQQAGGNYELIHVNGPHSGKAFKGTGTHESWPDNQPPDDNWTHVPGHGYTRLDFHWDKMHPVNNNLNDMSQGDGNTPMKKNEKKLSLPEALAHLKDGLSKKIADFEAQTEALQKAESLEKEKLKKGAVQSVAQSAAAPTPGMGLALAEKAELCKVCKSDKCVCDEAENMAKAVLGWTKKSEAAGSSPGPTGKKEGKTPEGDTGKEPGGDEGSGGDIKKGKDLKKNGMSMKPPAMPKAPKAPAMGAGTPSPVAKEELEKGAANPIVAARMALNKEKAKASAKKAAEPKAPAPEAPKEGLEKDMLPTTGKKPQFTMAHLQAAKDQLKEKLAGPKLPSMAGFKSLGSNKPSAPAKEAPGLPSMKGFKSLGSK